VYASLHDVYLCALLEGEKEKISFVKMDGHILSYS
jgi:hypothetical protein